MCGINAIIVKEKFLNLENSIKKMNNLIIHRGPDDAGIYFNNNVALGMRRLSIIDLISGNQPMYNVLKNIIIVFNGEIYNFDEIKIDLINKGYSFRTNSDTEIILLGYEYYGIEILKKLNGMFSFVIYDLRSDKIFIARDRLGEKPLYYYKDSSFFLVASELKSIINVLPDFNIKKPNISKTGLNLYFSLTYIPAPHSIYENIYKLEPGNFLEINLNNFTLETFKYWKIDLELLSNKINDYDYSKKKLRELLFDSVNKRMISDVPLGSFLSGGVDSSIITAIMANINLNSKINTFSLVSNNKYFDESSRSNAVAKHLNTNHSQIKIDIEELKSNYNKIILNFDEPFGDSSAIPSYFISNKTREFVKVALTGDGGDEVFGGYNRYFMPIISQKYKSVVPKIVHQRIISPSINSIKHTNDDRGFLFKLQKLINGIGETEFDDLSNIMSLGFIQEEKSKLLTEKYADHSNVDFIKNVYNQTNGMNILNKSRFLDMMISLEGDMLAKVDRSSMLASLECRAPLLDHRLMEFSYQLPSKYLVKNIKTKFILKDTFKDLLPKGLFELPKSGFGVPVGDWLRDDFKSDLLNLTEINFLINQGIFDPEYVTRIVNEHIFKIKDHTFKIWTIFCFQKWYIQNF